MANRLEPSTGGMPRIIENLMKIQSRIDDSVYGLLHFVSVNPDATWKVGCHATSDGTNLSVSSGVVYHNKEFFLVDTHSIPFQAGQPYGFAIKKVVDPQGSLVYASGQTHDTLVELRMDVTYVSTGENAYVVEYAQAQAFKFVLDHEWSGTQLRFNYSDGTNGSYVDLKGETGATGAPGAIGATPAHQWSGTSLRFQNPDGSWGGWVDLKGETGANGLNGTNGVDGATGATGEIGPRPDHEWNNTQIRFQKPDGSWGVWVDLGLVI